MVRIILYLFTILSVQNCKNDNSTNGSLKDYLELSVEISGDTISSDSTFTMTALFYNKTDSCIMFYPKAVMSIIRLSGGFGGDDILFLNKALDLREVRTIEPHKTYRETFIIPVTAPVFRKGVNYFKLYYLSKELGGKMKVYNKLTGSLESDEFLIYIN